MPNETRDEDWIPQPSIEQIMQWSWESSGCEATDGCWVEEDGTCEHGHQSWILVMGLV